VKIIDTADDNSVIVDKIRKNSSISSHTDIEKKPNTI